jgi:hypothetical protein
MCEEISSRISSLQVENDEARLLKVGVRPSSSLQQAPWWIKIPKRFTWLNLPDGVTDAQKDKDLARMGISQHYPISDTIGIRTPSPDIPHRKRKKRHSDFEERKRARRESYVPEEYDDFEDRYPHLSGPPFSSPHNYQEIHVQNDPEPTMSLDTLLQVVEDDMRIQLEPPHPYPYYQNHPEPFNHMPYQYAEPEFKAPLLPRPSMMPPDSSIPGNFLPLQHPIRHPIQPATLPPLRLESSDGVARLSTSSDTRGVSTPLSQIELRRPFFPAMTSSLPPIKSTAEPPPQPVQPVTPITEPRPQEFIPQPTPKPIAPRPGSAPPPHPPPPFKPTPIQPSPSTKSRTTSTSPDHQRTKRPLALLPKLSAYGPPPDHTPQRRYPPPAPYQAISEDDRPVNERYPLSLYKDPKPSTLPGPACAPPPPPPAMGRFVNTTRMELTVHPFMQYPPNPKIAISRLPNQMGYESAPVPLRIAPAPRKNPKSEPMANFAETIRKKDNGDGSWGNLLLLESQSKETPVTMEVRRDDERKADGKEVGKPGKENVNKENDNKDSGEVEGGRPGLRSSSLRRKHV